MTVNLRGKRVDLVCERSVVGRERVEPRVDLAFLTFELLLKHAQRTQTCAVVDTKTTPVETSHFRAATATLTHCVAMSSILAASASSWTAVLSRSSAKLAAVLSRSLPIVL